MPVGRFLLRRNGDRSDVGDSDGYRAEIFRHRFGSDEFGLGAGGGIRRHGRAIDQEADIRGVRIVVMHGEQHGLRIRLSFAIRAVREETALLLDHAVRDADDPDVVQKSGGDEVLEPPRLLVAAQAEAQRDRVAGDAIGVMARERIARVFARAGKAAFYVTEKLGFD